MKETQSPTTLLGSIPGWEKRPAKIIPMHGGLNNHCYLVESGGFQYVLRIAAENGVAGGGNRAIEYLMQQQAATNGLAAPVLYADAGRGLLLTEYLVGKVLDTAALRQRENLQQLGELLRRLHALPLCGVRFDAKSAARDYERIISPGLSKTKIAQLCMSIINGATPAPELRCCHNDVIGSNLVQGDSLRLIDFEYACDNDPLFDLASVICWHHLGDLERNCLLEAYATAVTPDIQERLQGQCRIYDALQWLWLAVRQRQAPASWLEQQLAQTANRLQLK